MIENWDKTVASAGWNQHEDTPFFYKHFGDKLFFSATPDTATGIFPVEINQSLVYQQNLFDMMRKHSGNIYIGDRNNVWGVEGYGVMQIDYQVIDTTGLKLEKDTRNQISQAEKFGVTIESTGKLSSYEPLVEETADRQDRDPISNWKLQHLWKNNRFLLASHEGRVIAGCIYGQSHEGLHLLHSASLKEFQNLRPNHAVYNRLIQIASGRKIWLGNSPKQLEGLKKFKESFGAKLFTFPLKYYEV